jgi:hypothetical protein
VRSDFLAFLEAKPLFAGLSSDGLIWFQKRGVREFVSMRCLCFAVEYSAEVRYFFRLRILAYSVVLRFFKSWLYFVAALPFSWCNFQSYSSYLTS